MRASSPATARRPPAILITTVLLAIFALPTAHSRAQPAASPAGQAGATAGTERGGSLDEAALLGPPQGRPLAGAELDAETRALGERMRCPVCQGLSIADSPSASALAMVAEVRELLSRGYTRKQVLDYFVRAYGEFVLLQPTANGFNVLVWVLPLAFVLGGALLIVRRLRAARRLDGPGGSAGPGSGDEDLDPYLERVRSEVGR